jgi:hypothetical protein
MTTTRLSRSFRTPGRVAAKEFLFQRAGPAVSPFWYAGKTSSAGSQKVVRRFAGTEVRKNPGFRP